MTCSVAELGVQSPGGPAGPWWPMRLGEAIWELRAGQKLSTVLSDTNLPGQAIKTSLGTQMPLLAAGRPWQAPETGRW